MLEEELLYWEVENRNLRRYGRQVEEINREFGIIMQSLAEYFPDKHMALSLNKRIPALIKDIDRLRPSNEFDAMVAIQHHNSLMAQYEFTELIFVKNYTEQVGLKKFLDFMFGEAEAKPKGHALKELENMARRINWKKISKMRSLMLPITMRLVDSDYDRIRAKIPDELRKARKVINKYLLDIGFVTKEQADIIDKLQTLDDIDEVKDSIGAAFGMPFAKIPDYLRERMFRSHGMSEDQYNKLAMERDELLSDETIQSLYYNIDLTSGEGASWDPNTKQLEIGRPEFMFYKDEKTHKIKLFAGEVLRIIGHEGYHRVRTLLSQFMPAGLKGGMGEYAITSRITDEGLSMLFEDKFMEYVNENRPFNISKKDIERVKLAKYFYRTKRIIDFLYSVYHRLADTENRDIEAAARLATVTKNQALSDPKYLGHQSIHETFEDSFYIYGLPAIENIMERLIKEKTRERGNRRNAMHHIKRNEKIYLAGLLVGHWGQGALEEFYFDHYLPRAKKLKLLRK